MTQATESDCDPLTRLLTAEPEERPEEIAVDELTTMNTEEFVDRLESLAAAAEAIDTMARDLERLRNTGLSDSDARDLIFGRNNSLNKGEIDAMFKTIDALIDGTADRPLERLLSDLSGANISEASELLDELDRLAGKYGGDEDV